MKIDFPLGSTVKDLVAALQQMPQDAPMVVIVPNMNGLRLQAVTRMDDVPVKIGQQKATGETVTVVSIETARPV